MKSWGSHSDKLMDNAISRVAIVIEKHETYVNFYMFHVCFLNEDFPKDPIKDLHTNSKFSYLGKRH